MKSWLRRLVAHPTLAHLGWQVRTLNRKIFFPPLYAWRKSRLAAHGVPGVAALQELSFSLEGGCGCAEVGYFTSKGRLAMRELSRAGFRLAPWDALRQTAMAIRLDAYPDFETWRKRVSRETDGKYPRSANRARRSGFVSHEIGLDSHRRSLSRLLASKLRRSKGFLVWAALLGPRTDLIDTLEPPWRHACPRHGRVAWGAFRRGEGGETLAAYAVFRRSGEMIWVDSFIGHGEALREGVTKMMMFDIMQWVLAREDPFVQGARLILHGSLEEGSAGLADWKRYLAFEPVLLAPRETRPRRGL